MGSWEARGMVIDDGIGRLHQLLTGLKRTDPDTLADLLVNHADAGTREDDVALILATTAPVNTTVQRTSQRNSDGAAA